MLVAARTIFAAEDNAVGEAIVTLAEAELRLDSGEYVAAARAARRPKRCSTPGWDARSALLARWLRGEIARRLGHTEQASAR